MVSIKRHGIFPSRPRLTCLWKCEFDRVRKSCTYVNPRTAQLTVAVRLRGTMRAVVGFKVFLIASVFVPRMRSCSLVYAGTQLVSDGRAISWSVILSNLKPKIKKENMSISHTISLKLIWKMNNNNLKNSKKRTDTYTI